MTRILFAALFATLTLAGCANTPPPSPTTPGVAGAGHTNPQTPGPNGGTK